MSDREAGFTLIEMIVALAVFSLAALALLRLEGATVATTARLADANVAQIVVRNLAVVVQTDPAPPTIGNTSGAVTNGGAIWRWTRDAKRTDDVRVIRVDFVVADAAGRRMAQLSIARAAA